LVYTVEERRASTSAKADRAVGVNSMEQTRSFLSRRKLLVGLSGIAAASVALMASPFRAVIAMTTRDLVRSQPVLRRMLLSLGDAGYDEWLDQVGTTFAVGGGTNLKLIGVSAFNNVGQRPIRLGRSQAFQAKFDVQNGGTMAGDLIYTALHPRYGAFNIFLTASSNPNTPHRMTAIFN
jgi:hypothetical protein